METLARLNEKYDRLQNSLCALIEHFRNGEDAFGLDDLVNFIDDLESVVDLYQCLGEPKLKIDEIVSVLQKLYFYMRNQDVVGITDLLEFAIFPLSKEWALGCDEQ